MPCRRFLILGLALELLTLPNRFGVAIAALDEQLMRSAESAGKI
jgi:hypothetical protein